MDQDNSVELLKKISAGDEHAFADFYSQYETRLYRFIKSKLNDSFESSDILNEVFLEVWKKASTFEGRSKVSTWLFGIAYYKTMDRHRKKVPTPVDDDYIKDVEDESPDQSTCLINVENASSVHHCLKTLTSSHHEVMELAFFNDMSYQEIATVIGCPEGTVKTRMFHAKKSMKRCLSELFMRSEI
jgi:RNA polymerase sigma-70 factor (ECF subfamily)